MKEAASTDDLRRMLQHRRDDATAALGRETAQIQSKAALQGALGGGRLGLQYIEATERTWRELVDTAFSDIRRFLHATQLPPDAAVSVAREELEIALRYLRETSKFDAPAGSRYRDSPAAMERYEEEWAKLPPYLNLKIRHFELGLEETATGARPSVTYSIQANTISGPIQQGTHQSTQTVVVSGDTLLTKLETTIQNEIVDHETRDALLGLVNELSVKKGTPDFLGTYQRFMSAAANHVTVLAPFLPALAQMIG